MSGNLLDQVQGSLGGGALTKLSGLLGQTPSATQSAIGSVTPVLLGGLANKAQTPGGADEIYRSLDGVDDRILDDVPGFYSGNSANIMSTGSGMLNGIFGGNLNNIHSKLGSYSGLGSGGTGKLMALITPVVMAHLARQRRRNGLNAAGLASYLNEQRRYFESRIPSGLGAVYVGPKERIAETVRTEPRRVGRTVAEPEPPYEHREKSSALKWVLPVLGIAAVAALAFGLFRDRPDADESVGIVDDSVQGVQGTAEEVDETVDETGEGIEYESEEMLGMDEEGERVEDDVTLEDEGEVEEDVTVAEPTGEGMEGEEESTVDETGAAVGAETGAGMAVEEGAEQEGAEQEGAEQQDTGMVEETREVDEDAEYDAEGQPIEEEDVVTDEVTEWEIPEEPLYLGQLFDSGQGELAFGTDERMEALKELIQDNPDKDVEVRGYSFGADTARTRGLALERAQEVVDWLVENGIDEERLTAVGGGPSSQSQIDVFLK